MDIVSNQLSFKGNLALSRALGDFEFKKADLPPEKQAVTGIMK